MMEFAMQDLWLIFAMFAAIVFLKITMDLLCYLKYELNYYLQALLKSHGEMERFLRQATYSSADICRAMRRDIEEYEDSDESSLGEKIVKFKRRMRDHFEAWMKSREVICCHSIQQRVTFVWSIVCSQVMLQSCTDIVASRALALHSKKPLEPQKVEKDNKILQNVQINWCRFWIPLHISWRSVENLKCDNFMLMVLQNDLLDMRDMIVFQAGKLQSNEEFDKIFAGMPILVQTILELHVFQYESAKCRKRTRSSSSEH